jgi:hypothetical protein
MDIKKYQRNLRDGAARLVIMRVALTLGKILIVETR